MIDIDIDELNRLHAALPNRTWFVPDDARPTDHATIGMSEAEWLVAASLVNAWPELYRELTDARKQAERLATLEAENLEWLRIVRGYLDADMDSETEREWLCRMDAMRRGRAGIHTPIPIVESMAARLATLEAACEAAETLMAFHEGSAKAEREGGHPTVVINGEDHAELLATLRTALAETKKAGA